MPASVRRQSTGAFDLNDIALSPLQKLSFRSRESRQERMGEAKARIALQYMKRAHLRTVGSVFLASWSLETPAPIQFFLDCTQKHYTVTCRPRITFWFVHFVASWAVELVSRGCGAYLSKMFLVAWLLLQTRHDPGRVPVRLSVHYCKSSRGPQLFRAVDKTHLPEKLKSIFFVVRQ